MSAEEVGPTLRLHDFVSQSRANGPGRRVVLWVQGCSLGCPGCFNPATHPTGRGREVPADEVARSVVALEEQVDGFTVSGGEPLQQATGVAAILRKVCADTDLSTLLFTGFTWEEMRSIPGSDAVLDHLDVLVTGRYREDLHVGRGLLGSRNQTVHYLTDRHSPDELADVPEAEVLVRSDGSLVATGIGGPELDC